MKSLYSKKAFTLIELLVVVAIIALLVSILVPALSKARDQAKQVVCLSNLKTAYLTWLMYSQTNRDVIPPVGTLNGVIWCDLLMPYMDQTKAMRVLSPQKPDTTAFMCPSNPVYFTDAAAQVHSFNYAMNDRCGVVWSDGTPQWMPTMFQAIKNPSEKILFSDGKAGWTTTYTGKKLITTNCWSDPGEYYKSYDYLVGLMHGAKTGANFLWADGHSTFEFKNRWNTKNLQDKTGIGWWELSEKEK